MPIQPANCSDDCPLEPIPVCFTMDCETDSVTVCNTGAILHNGAQFAVSAAPVQIMIANPSRKKLIVQNVGTGNVRIGTSLVSPTTGTRLVPDGSMIIDMPDVPVNEIWAIREGGTDTIVFAQDIS